MLKFICREYGYAPLNFPLKKKTSKNKSANEFLATPESTEKIQGSQYVLILGMTNVHDAIWYEILVHLNPVNWNPRGKQ